MRRHEFELRSSEARTHLFDRVQSYNDADAIVENIAAGCDSIASKVVEPLDGLYGEAPEWFEYL